MVLTRLLVVVAATLLLAAGCAGRDTSAAGRTIQVTRGAVIDEIDASGRLTAVGAALELGVPVEVREAERVNPGAPVDVSVDDVPGLALRGQVKSVGRSTFEINGVWNRQVVVDLLGSDNRVAPGMTAHAAVVVLDVRDVLVVPNSAVIWQLEEPDAGPGCGFVIAGDGDPVRFQLGAVGRYMTQVIGGLEEGQVVRLPEPPSAGGAAGAGGGVLGEHQIVDWVGHGKGMGPGQFTGAELSWQVGDDGRLVPIAPAQDRAAGRCSL